MARSFDVIFIGAGPAGYVGAIRAAQNGLKVACIDDWKNRDGTYAFGGTCLNAGCIPSKALLESSELYHRAREEFAVHGIRTGEVALDLAAMQARKAKIVSSLTGGIKALFQANGVTGLVGRGRLLASGRVAYTPVEGPAEELEAREVVLATGSEPIPLAAAPFDGVAIVDSWGALEFDAVPKRLGVIGAGVIGLELGSVWRRLGSEVVLLEALPEFLPAVDVQASKEAFRQFTRLGLDIRLGSTVVEAKAAGKKGPVRVRYRKDSGEETLEVDRLVVAVGRRPLSREVLAEGTGVRVDARGFVEVDEHCRTSRPHVWAIGDLVRGPMLAHKGSEEGVMVADLIAGRSAEVNYATIPSVIYTAPEVAWVGKTEQTLRKEGVPFKAGSFPFSANGRAKALEAAQGFVKILAHAETDEILGVHIVGPAASELVAEAVLAMEFQASAEDIALTVHAHPTLAEATHEAALAVDGRSIHAINKKKAG
jgi:dihydrolipoamide dehydrogenase